MPHIAETRHLPWSPEQMFDLVADVKRYGEFLPWVVGTRIRSDSGTEMVADMPAKCTSTALARSRSNISTDP